jgi:hypothetical protein
MGAIEEGRLLSNSSGAGSGIQAPHSNAPAAYRPFRSSNLPAQTGTFFYGEELVLSDLKERAREQLLLLLLGPSSKNDEKFDNRLIAKHLDNFELVPGEIRCRVITERWNCSTGTGMEYNQAGIHLEAKSSGEWVKIENLSLSCVTGNAYRDGQNRKTELTLEKDSLLGNIPDEYYKKLFAKLIDITPADTDIFFSTDDPLSLYQLFSVLPEDYDNFVRPRDFYFSRKEVAKVFQEVKERLLNSENTNLPLLSDYTG